MSFQFRSDYLRLAKEEKPDATKLVDGCTCYEVDTGKFYISYEGEWHDQDFEGGK